MKRFRAPSRPLAAEAVTTDRGAAALPAQGRRRGAGAIAHMPDIQNSLAAQWLRARRARTRVTTATAQSPSRVLRTVRRWSPGVVPPLVGGILLAGAIFFATQHTLGQPSSLAPDTLLKMVVAYLLCGAAYGVLLYLAASDLVWLCVLLLGAALYAVVTAGVFLGPGTALVIAILFGLLVVWYMRGNAQTVPDGRVLVTGFAGGYARTLYPGRAVLVPFERELATLETGEHHFTCPMQTAEVPNELGEVYVARAMASVAYSLIPSEAHHTLALGSAWEHELQNMVPLALREALGEWGAHILMGDSAPPEKLLGKTLLRELREQVRPYGIHVISVSVRDIWLVPEDHLPYLDDTTATLVDYRHTAVERPCGTSAPLAAPHSGAQPSEPVTARAIVPVATAPEPAEALSSEVLSDAYEAVREGRINDPTTIRQIARAFLRIADDPALNTDFPFDATAAARILLERAQALDHPR